MGPRLASLVAIDVALATLLVVVWERAHSSNELDFIPIVRGLKPQSSSGNFNRARSDVFLVHRPFEALCREMRQTHWTEVTAATFTRFDADSPTHGFGMLLVLIFNGRLKHEAPEGWCKVVVIRGIRPFPKPRPMDRIRLT
jgi:hypothetical protein